MSQSDQEMSADSHHASQQSMQNEAKTKTENFSDDELNKMVDDDYDPQQDKSEPKIAVRGRQQHENSIKFEIRNISDFKICLESVKFPLSQKGRFNDVILQVQATGIVLKSSDRKGNMMTRTMIKKEFFTDNSYQFEVRQQTSE